jgi:glyoxylase-like metal-dependent hydrolase (beta-lactamase superfamily II)
VEDIIEDDKVRIIKLELKPFGTNAYILVCKDTSESLIVDVPGETNKILSHLEGTDPKYIVVTHSHIDHIAALQELINNLSVPVAIHSLDANSLRVSPDIKLSDGDYLPLGRSKIKVFHTPGHTQGSICLLINKFLISGDTIFPGGPGKTGTPVEFMQIVNTIRNKVFVLPDDVVIFPGHGDSTVIGREKAEFALFDSVPHDPKLHGDVLWRSSK